jgi:DNA replication factor GINS
MPLEELRTILLSERETGRLTSVPHDIFETTKKELEELTSDVHANVDPFSDRTRVLIERASSIRETLQDLFRIRAEKILALSSGHIDGNPLEKEEIKKMLPAEREMFDTVTGAIAKNREICIITRHDQMPEFPARKEFPATGDEGAGGPVPVTGENSPLPPGQGYVLARVLNNMEPFMGVDGRIYHLTKEDIVTLPRRNAEVLNERNIVLNITPGK